MQSYFTPQSTHEAHNNNLPHATTSTGFSARELYQRGSHFEDQYDLGSACHHYYLAAQAGSTVGKKALLRLIRMPNFDLKLSINYTYKMVAILADPTHPLFDRATVKDWMETHIDSLERNNHGMRDVVFSDKNLFRLSPYFHNVDHLFDLVMQSHKVCVQIAEHDHLARTLKGYHFALLDEFRGVTSGYISHALKAYNYFSALADSALPDTEVSFPATDELARQISIAGLSDSRLTRLGRRFFPIALALCHNGYIGSDSILIEIALLNEKIKTDPNLLILAAQELTHHAPVSDRNVRWQALLYARAASLGSKPALDVLRTLNKINNNKFTLLLDLCDSDHKLSLFAKNVTKRVNDAEKDLLRVCLPFLQHICAEHHSHQWQRVADLIKQLGKLPDHYSIKRIIYQKLISILMRPDVKTRLSDTLNGLLIYADDIELLNKVVEAAQLADLIEVKARTLESKDVADANTLKDTAIRFINYYNQDLSTMRSEHHSQFLQFIDDALESIKNPSAKDYLNIIKQELMEIFQENIEIGYVLNKLT